MKIPMSEQNSPKRARGRPRDWHDKTAQNTIKSLDRAMGVFEFLSEGAGKTLSTLAKELGESPATLYRILVTLEGRGLVEFDQAEQVWNIGPRAFIIGSRFLRRTSLVDRARPLLRSLMEATGETANLGIEQNGHVLFVSQVETHASIRAFFPQERNLGMRCIAAPVFDIHGEAIAGISVSGPTSRVGTEQTAALSRAVLSAAQDLSSAIGGDV